MKMRYLRLIREGSLIHSTRVNGNSSFRSLILSTHRTHMYHMTNCSRVKYWQVRESTFLEKRGFNLWTTHHKESPQSMFPHLNGAFSMISKMKNLRLYPIRAISCQGYIQMYIYAKEMDSKVCKDTVARSNWNSRISRPISSTKKWTIKQAYNSCSINGISR